MATVYYRLYTKDKALKIHNPTYSNNQFVSRVSSKSIAPPRTAGSLKKHLWRIETFENDPNCVLYLSLSDNAPTKDSARLALRGDHGPGSSERDPVVLVVSIPASEKRLGEVSQVASKSLLEWPHEQRYGAVLFDIEVHDFSQYLLVYYRVYDEGGEVVSKTSFDPTDSALGRIDPLSIPPPHTVASLKTSLNQAEGIFSLEFQLFLDDNGETLLNDNDTINFLSDNYPGISEAEPMATVYKRQQKINEQKQKITEQPREFSKTLRANQKSSEWRLIDYQTFLIINTSQPWEITTRHGTLQYLGRYSRRMGY